MTDSGPQSVRGWLDEARSRVAALKASHMTYQVLWVLGALSAISATITVLHHSITDTLKVTDFAVIFVLGLLITTNWVHQYLIYESLHQVDYEAKTREDFAPWVGSGWELIIRIAAFFMLLEIAGKIVSVETFSGVKLTPIEVEKAKALLVIGCSSLLFFLFCLWNICARQVIRRADEKRYHVVRARLNVYLLSDATALLLWLLLLAILNTSDEHARGFLLAFVLLLPPIYGAIVIYMRMMQTDNRAGLAWTLVVIGIISYGLFLLKADLFHRTNASVPQTTQLQ